MGILRNGRKPDAATPRGGRRFSDCKPLSWGKKLLGVMVPQEEATANSVPAAAVIQRWQALFGITGLKGRVGVFVSHVWKPLAQPGKDT